MLLPISISKCYVKCQNDALHKVFITFQTLSIDKRTTVEISLCQLQVIHPTQRKCTKFKNIPLFSLATLKLIPLRLHHSHVSFTSADSDFFQLFADCFYYVVLSSNTHYHKFLKVFLFKPKAS